MKCQIRRTHECNLSIDNNQLGVQGVPVVGTREGVDAERHGVSSGQLEKQRAKVGVLCVKPVGDESATNPRGEGLLDRVPYPTSTWGHRIDRQQDLLIRRVQKQF